MTAKPLILIVDDTATNIQALAEGLAGDYRLKVATGGLAALAVLDKQEPPDLILLDVMMPDMDGYEVCSRLKLNPQTRGIPVIFITAMNDVEDEERGLRLGAVDYVAKPFHMPIVKARIQNHIRLKLMADKLEAMAWMDGLTGISNRRRFDEVLEMEWKRAQRAAVPLSLLMMDVDHFKEYNDRYGHGAGDDCLRAVAASLEASVARAGDLLARYGGEEFVLVLPGTDAAGARLLAEQLRLRVEECGIPHAGSPVSSRVTLSIGCASVVPPPGGDASALLAEADRMLYAAKKAGRNCVCGL